MSCIAAASPAGSWSATRAAASSIARGRPSRRRHRSTTSPVASPSMRKRLSASRARAANSWTASDWAAVSDAASWGGRPSGETSKRCSPVTRSGVRLVTRIVVRGAACSRSVTTGHASTTCSKLSSTSSIRRPCTTPATSARRSWCGAARTSRASAIALSTRSGPATASSATQQAPSGNVGATAAATARASRVLPIPPVPVSVISRAPSVRSAARSASSSARPTNVEGGAGSPSARASRTEASREGCSRLRSCRRTAASTSRNAGPGSTPSSSARKRRVLRHAANASAWRCARYRAMTWAARRRSRNGWSSISRAASATTTAGGSRASRSSSRSSVAASRRSASEASSGSAAGVPARSGNALPRHNSRADPSRRAAPGRSRAPRLDAASPIHWSNTRKSTSWGRTVMR